MIMGPCFSHSLCAPYLLPHFSPLPLRERLASYALPPDDDEGPSPEIDTFPHPDLVELYFEDAIRNRDTALLAVCPGVCPDPGAHCFLAHIAIVRDSARQSHQGWVVRPHACPTSQARPPASATQQSKSAVLRPSPPCPMDRARTEPPGAGFREHVPIQSELVRARDVPTTRGRARA